LFLYIKKGSLERLWNDHSKNKQKNYRKYASFHGVFPEIMNDYFDSMDISINNKPHCTVNDYETFKDDAIKQIGHKDMGMSKKEQLTWRKLNGLKRRICRVKCITQTQLGKELGLDGKYLREWANIPLEDTDLLGNHGFEEEEADHIMTLKVEGPKNDQDEPRNEPYSP
jgi:hypothetical protein